MRRALQAALALAGLLALLAVAGAADATHPSAGIHCPQPYRCDFNLRPPESQSQDTWVLENDPSATRNSGVDGGRLEVAALDGQRAWAFVKFPLEQLPRNATIHEARMVMFRPGNFEPTRRVVQVWEVRAPWDEATLNWTIAQALATNPVGAVNNRSTSAEPEDLQGGGAFGFGLLTFQNDCRPGGCNDGDDREPHVNAGFTQSFRKFYRGLEPYHGHLLRDGDLAAGGLRYTQRFASSADGMEQNRPRLNVVLHPNPPELLRLQADGREVINATSTRPVNLSALVFDRMGDIVDVWINVTTPEGKEVLNRSVFRNRTSTFRENFLHTVWSNESLGLPEGKYFLNVIAVDTDGNLNSTVFKAQTPPGVANLTIENTPPTLNRSAIAVAPQLDEGQGFTATATVYDDSGIDRVFLKVERAGQEVGNASFERDRVDGNHSGDWRLAARAAWAGDVTLRVGALDRAGNVNLSAGVGVRIRDVLPPSIQDAKVLAPGSGVAGPVQEAGGVVRWEALVRDASPLEVVLELGLPAGASPSDCPGEAAGSLCKVAMAPVGTEGRYEASAPLARAGAYTGRLVATDPDGNRDQRAGLGFVVEEARPPEVSGQQPAPGKVATASPRVVAVITDLNLEPSSIVVEARSFTAALPDRPAFAAVEVITEVLGPTARRVELRDPRFFHGETVEVRVRAGDLLGQEALASWSFTVDARPPATFLAPTGNFLAGERTIITGNTTLRVERQDQGSGVLATVVAVVNEDRGTGLGNTTVTGDGPFQFNLSGLAELGGGGGASVFAGSGNYSVYVSSVDVAGNLEDVQRRRFLVDDTPPRVSVDFEPGLLTARVEERGAGVREVLASYWLAPGGQQGTVPMSPSPQAGVYRAQIPDAERGTRVLYAVEAVDQMGNAGRAGTPSSPLSSIIQNHAPDIVLSPPNGSLVRGALDIEWSVTDRDGDSLQVSLSARPSTSDTAQDLAALRGPQGTFRWDTPGIPDGVWVLRLEARDGFGGAVDEHLLDVSNTDSKIAAVGARAAQPGEPAVVEATLYKPVRQAQAVVTFAGREVARVALADDGAAPDRRARDGVFTAAFVPPRAGDYRVALEVVFEDGQLETSPGATLAVQHAFPARIWSDPVVFVVVVVAPLAALGAWAYRRWGPIGPRR